MPWFNVDDGFDEDPRVDALLEADERHGLSVVGALMLLGAGVARQMTDGHVSARRIARLLPGTGDDVAGQLVDAGFAERTDSGLYLPDYLVWNRSKDAIAEAKEKRREAGKRGAEQRWNGNRNSDRNGTSHGNANGDRNAAAEARGDGTIPSTPLPSTPSPTTPAEGMNDGGAGAMSPAAHQADDDASFMAGIDQVAAIVDERFPDSPFPAAWAASRERIGGVLMLQRDVAIRRIVFDWLREEAPKWQTDVINVGPTIRWAARKIRDERDAARGSSARRLPTPAEQAAGLRRMAELEAREHAEHGAAS